MRPFAAVLWRTGRAHGLVVARLRYGVRGWNGDARSPVTDARWALRELTRRFPGVAVGLVGHSMGGRAALAVADDPAVISVVALAPWIEPSDRSEPLAGRRLLIAHGSLDRVTDPAASAEFAERARAFAAQVTYVDIAGEKHAMLRRPMLWHHLAAGFSVGTLFDRTMSNDAPFGTGGAQATNVVKNALAGQHSLTV
jgi:alpha-beta hydrolase superfamily lysophospholipase